ncbi:unnamed protein product, partial [Amoebophrya sp. A25]
STFVPSSWGAPLLLANVASGLLRRTYTSAAETALLEDFKDNYRDHLVPNEND